MGKGPKVCMFYEKMSITPFAVRTLFEVAAQKIGAADIMDQHMAWASEVGTAIDSVESPQSNKNGGR